MPTEVDELRRRMMQMEIEEAALKKEDDRLSMERLANLQKELAEVKEEFNNRSAQWENEKKSVENLSHLREEIEDMNAKIQIAQREGDYEKAAELSYGKLPELKKQLEIEEEKVKNASISRQSSCSFFIPIVLICLYVFIWMQVYSIRQNRPWSILVQV